MPLVPLEIPPGVSGVGTDLQASGRWRDASLVRWQSGTLAPVGGWVQFAEVDIGAPARGMIAWRDNANDQQIAAGTFEGLHSISGTGVVQDITPVGLSSGFKDADKNTAYGGGSFGTGKFGVERVADGAIIPATTWTLDTWGQNLVAANSWDGKLYEWDLIADSAEQIDNSPENCQGLMVTDERFLFALGADGDPRLVKWSDREDNTKWSPEPTNQAGDIRLQTSGTILCGLNVRGQSLMLTTTDAHSATYIGPPYVYSFQKVGTSCGVVSAQAAASIDQGALWMGQHGFYSYEGGSVANIPCEVEDAVFDDFNYNQQSKVACAVNSEFDEVWWFYPSSGSIENDSYVFYDYVQGIWGVGKLSRTAGFDIGVLPHPVFAGADGKLWAHETGWDYGGAKPYAESAPIFIGSGDRIMSAVKMIPDERTLGQVQARFKTRLYPTGPEQEFGPYEMSNPTSVRFTGRQLRMRVEGVAAANWRVGTMRLDLAQRGRR